MDIWLSDLFGLKRFRAEVAVGAMSACSIVIYFDIFKDRLSHKLSSGEPLTVNGFNFERVKEALRACIVVAVAGAAHAT